MENELRSQIRQNWCNLKEEVSSTWRTIAGACLEEHILDFDDLERIKKLDTDSDRIEAILLKVIQRRKCEVFFNILEKDGFGRLCNVVRNTEVQREVTDRELTYVVGNAPTTNESERYNIIIQEIAGLKDDFRQNNEKARQREEAIHEEMRQHTAMFNEALSFKPKYEDSQKNHGQLQKEYQELQEKYKTLQSSQEYLRGKNNDLTKRLQERNLNNHELDKKG